MLSNNSCHAIGEHKPSVLSCHGEVVIVETMFIYHFLDLKWDHNKEVIMPSKNTENCI